MTAQSNMSELVVGLRGHPGRSSVLSTDKASQDNTRWKFAFVSERAG